MTKGGGGVSQKMTKDDGGGGGGLETPKIGWHNMWTAPNGADDNDSGATSFPAALRQLCCISSPVTTCSPLWKVAMIKIMTIIGRVLWYGMVGLGNGDWYRIDGNF